MRGSMTKATLVPALLLLLTLCLVPARGEASHYLLTDLGLLAAEEVAALERVGITSSEQLLPRVIGPTERAALQRLLLPAAVSAERLRELACICDLLQLEGVGPTMVKLLRRAGVVDSRALASRDPRELAALVLQVNQREAIAGRVPEESHLAGWIGVARTLPVRVQ